MTLKELIELFYEHGSSISLIHLYFGDRVETYDNEEINSTLCYRYGVPIKTWKYEMFNDSETDIILDVYMGEDAL